VVARHVNGSLVEIDGLYRAVGVINCWGRVFNVTEETEELTDLPVYSASKRVIFPLNQLNYTCFCSFNEDRSLCTLVLENK